MNTLHNRHVVITGAGSGIGAAIAHRLSTAGAKLTLAGRQRAPLAALADELGCDGIFVASDFDVADRNAVAAGIAAARDALGPISILVNNAGQAASATFERTAPILWDSVVSVDLTGVFNVTQAALADLQAHGAGARIVNIASTAGLVGYAYVSAYCAAKHGVIGLTRALALELAKKGITVNAVCPGFTDTPMISRSIAAIVEKTGRTPSEALAELTRNNPQGRLVQPEEVADTVAWLVSPAASAITGQAIAVSGGEVMAG